MDNQFLSAILNDGADAFNNIYDIKITFPWTVTGLDYVTARAEGIKTPEIGTETQERELKGNIIDVPKPKQTGKREFEVTFRVDANYSLYSHLAKWVSCVTDPVSGGVANWMSFLGSVEITAAGTTYTALSADTGMSAKMGAIEGSATTPWWKFSQCWASKITQLDFKRKGSEELTYTVTFKYIDSKQPFMNGKGVNGGNTATV